MELYPQIHPTGSRREVGTRDERNLPGRREVISMISMHNGGAPVTIYTLLT